MLISLRRRLLIALLLGAAAAGARAGTSTLQNPTVTFSSVGVHNVVLLVCRGAGFSLSCGTKTKQITVLDPNPFITSAGTEGNTGEVGQLVHLLATGGGQPALLYAWEIALGATTITTLQGSEVWWNTTGVDPGLYTITLHLTNPVRTISATPLSLTLAAEQSLDFYTVAPCRIIDTRAPAVPLLGGVTRSLDATAGGCGVPATARSVALNVTAVNAEAAGSITLYPANYPLPTTIVVSFAAGATRASFAVIPLATAGAPNFAALASIPTGKKVDLVVDVVGYFAPTPP